MNGKTGKPQTAIAAGMFPKPPKLMEGKGVTDDEPGETYWKVSGGIRMTGMPGFDKTLSPTQMWQVSLLCANADKLSQSVKDSLAEVPPAPTETPGSSEARLRKLRPLSGRSWICSRVTTPSIECDS